MGNWLIILACTLLAMSALAGCGGTTPAENRRPAAATAPPPIPAEAVKVDKPVNVSFSTYSKEWPIGWQWIDPEEKTNPTPHDVKNGVLRIRVPSKKDLFADNRTAPRYLKAITGDFQIETHVKFSPKENYQGAGLLVFKDDKNYIRFERAYGGLGGGGEGLRLDIRKGEDYKPIVTPGKIPTESPEVDLKLVRSGRQFTAYWREDENSEWREAGEFESDFPDTILTGLIACNTAREVIVEFGYIRLAPVVKP